MQHSALNARDETSLRTACQSAARAQIDRYGWTLVSEADLVELLLAAIPGDEMPNNLQRMALTQYTIALYEACRQDDNLERREVAYRDLFRYLYRAAYNKWPDMAEDITQRALLLVYQQIDRCQSPATFLNFALYKLRHAAQQEWRPGSAEVPEEAAESAESDHSIEAPMLAVERMNIVVEALNRLSDPRKREVVALKFFGDLNDRQISERLGITEGYVRVLRFQALQQLRKDQQLHDYFS